MEEYFDVLNEKGNYTGRIETREKCHKDGLWHKAVHVWIVNDNNEILLQYRCAEKSLYPNLWDCSFAGHIGVGESSIEGLIREGKEELGIEVDLEKLEFVMTITVENVVYEKIISNEFDDVYILRQNIDINEIKFQKEEVSDAKYVSLEKFFEFIEKGDIVPHKIEYMVLKEILLKDRKNK